MTEINYISFEEALEIHHKTVGKSGGGDIGELDTGKLDSVLQHIQNDDYYPSFLDKLVHLFFCSCKFHCFTDGNKRIAITLSALFLLKNGYMAIANTFFREMENVSYHVAAGHIGEEMLREIMDAILSNTYDDNENLKLRVFNAISVEDEFY
ncbi:MAG: type II toxin-antitoxin system death-on-curing family toxin [Lachnospiraceae bacterium]